MPLSPPFLLGKHLSSITAVGGARDATTGVITYGSATSLADSIDYIRVNATNLSEMIVPVNATKVHNEKTLTDSGAVVGEIKKKKAAGAGSVLAAIAYNFDYIKVVATTDDGVTYTIEGQIGTHTDGVTSIGKNGNEVTILQHNLTTGGGVTRTQA